MAHDSRPLKRRRTEGPRTHALHHVQHQPAQTEPAAQDQVAVQGQLLRSLSAALTMVGFDSVKPSALEAFRAQTEEYMLHFLSTVRDSMLAARRTRPTPQDFSMALATADITPSALRPQLGLDLPDSISSPVILAPLPAEAAPPNLAPMLGTELTDAQAHTRLYIPAHFPPLPSRHAWQSTAVFAERERDPRKIRERATQEGIMAEQALRKLTAANKPRSRNERTESVAEKMRQQLWQDTLADVLGDEGGELQRDAGAGFVLDGQQAGHAGEEAPTPADLLRAGGGMLVNYDRGHWRKGAPLGAAR